MLFVFGSNSLLASQKLQEIKKHFFDRFDQSHLNFDEIEFEKNLEASSLASKINNPPFLSEKRLIVLRNVLSGLTKKDAKPWLKILENVPDYTILVFIDDASDDDFKKTEIGKTFVGQKDVYLYPFNDLTLHELFALGKKIAKESNFAISDDLLKMLLEKTGNDPWMVQNEIAKLSAYCTSRACQKSDLEFVGRHEFHDSMFAFLDALSSKNKQKTFVLLEEQRRHDPDDFFLWVMLMRQVKLLLGISEYLSNHPGAGKEEIAGALGQPPFVVQKTLPFVKKFQTNKLFSLYASMLGADKALKHSQIAPHILVEKLVFGLLNA